MACVLDLRQDKIIITDRLRLDGIFPPDIHASPKQLCMDIGQVQSSTQDLQTSPVGSENENLNNEQKEDPTSRPDRSDQYPVPTPKKPELVFYPEKTLIEQLQSYTSKLNLNISNIQILSLSGFIILSILVNARLSFSKQYTEYKDSINIPSASPSFLTQVDRSVESIKQDINKAYEYVESLPEHQSQVDLIEKEENEKKQELERTNSMSNLPATVALVEKYRPADGWLDKNSKPYNSEIYAPTSEIWRDEYGRVMHIENGFVIMKIPQRMGPIYELVESKFGISRYVLMAVATIESKQGTSMVSTSNCQGWGHYCPSTIRLFQRKNLLPASFDTYDEYYGVAGIAVHLWVSSLGLTDYRDLVSHYADPAGVPWPHFWNGETPPIQLFEQHSWAHPIIPATWGYNRSAFYGYSVAKLAQFYQAHDQR